MAESAGFILNRMHRPLRKTTNSRDAPPDKICIPVVRQFIRYSPGFILNELPLALTNGILVCCRVPHLILDHTQMSQSAFTINSLDFY